jgi:hypothetical protein
MPRTAAHLIETRWKPGVSANPKGRPKGSRSKLQELCLAMLHADFEQHGEETIARVRQRQPGVYLHAVVSLLPKQAEKVNSPFIDLTDDEIALLEEHLAAVRAKTVQMIEGAVELEPETQEPS